MPSKYNVFLMTAAQLQSESVAAHYYLDQKVWIKKASARHSTWIYLPLQWFSKLLGLQMLAPVPNVGGNDAIACEINRLETLYKLGINVPEVLAHQPNAVLIKDVATDHTSVQQFEQALAQQKTSEQRLQLFAKAVHAIQDIHTKGNYLSEAFARNILIDDQQKFSFIDFETDPGKVLSIQDCQTRDWLCLIFSTAKRFEEHELISVKEILSQSLGIQSQTYRDIARTGQKLAWLLKLKLEKLGSDGKRLKKCIVLLHSLHQ